MPQPASHPGEFVSAARRNLFHVEAPQPAALHVGSDCRAQHSTLTRQITQCAKLGHVLLDRQCGHVGWLQPQIAARKSLGDLRLAGSASSSSGGAERAKVKLLAEDEERPAR
jgi:hypothetical protein